MKLGVVAIARPTFDIPYAEAMAERAFAVVDGLDVDVVGPRSLVLDAGAATEAAAVLGREALDGLLVLQASFADSTLVAGIAAATTAPVTLWAFPEDRTGGRLRLNSLCGINLAAYVLRSADRDLRHLYADPTDPSAASALAARLDAAPRTIPDPPAPPDPAAADPADLAAADAVVARLATSRIGIVGDRPDGFEPCGYDEAQLQRHTGVRADPVPLPTLFTAADAPDDAAVDALRTTVAAELAGVGEVDQAALARSLRLHLGLRGLAEERGWDAVATRCWPECFTEFGGAACAPQSLLNDLHDLPGLCEADAYGAVTSLMLQWLVDAPVFVADLIHLDAADNTAVFWHCGLAPRTMADPEVETRATVHSNRKLPLLYEFPLRPGRITVARLSQSRGTHRLVIGSGEMLRAPLPFSGTAGVARLDTPVDEALSTVVDEGLEHHYGIAYGDVTGPLTAIAARLGLPVVRL